MPLLSQFTDAEADLGYRLAQVTGLGVETCLCRKANAARVESARVDRDLGEGD